MTLPGRVDEWTAARSLGDNGARVDLRSGCLDCGPTCAKAAVSRNVLRALMHSAWDEYRRRRRTFWLSMLLFPILFIAIAMISYLLAQHNINFDSILLMGLVIIAFVTVTVAHLRRLTWPCPRCGNPFHGNWFYGNLLVRRCVHFGKPQ